MSIITNFYKKTNGFWKITRILFIPLFTYPLFKVIGNKNLFNAILNASCAVYVVLLILILINKSSYTHRKTIRKWAGILSILYGIIMSVFLIKMEFALTNITASYFQIIPIWIIMFGFWELNSSN